MTVCYKRIVIVTVGKRSALYLAWHTHRIRNTFIFPIRNLVLTLHFVTVISYKKLNYRRLTTRRSI